MTTTTLPPGITAASATAQIDSSVATVLSAADTTSANRIQNLSFVHQARVARLTRDSASATAQYGATSTQAAAAQQDLSAAQTTLARIQIVHLQAATAAPQVTATGWALHGRVYNAQLQPVSNYTVFLVDSQKTYQEPAGFAYTDSTGYFLLNFAGSAPAPASGSAQPSTSAGATAATGGTAEPATPQAQAATQDQPLADQLFVQIANASAKPVYLSESEFQPSIGNALYQNITLPAGEPVLGDPPEAIRKVALPPQK